MNAPPDAPAHALRCLKAAGPRSVWLVRRPHEAARTVKAWPLTPAFAAKLILGIAQPQRQRRGARRLALAGIPTPPVVRGPHLTRRGGATLVQLELEHVEGESALELLERGRPAEIGPAAAAVAALLAGLVQARLFNRDLKLSNIVIAQCNDLPSPAGPPRPTAWLVDPVAIRAMRRPDHDIMRMLDRLVVEARERGIHVPPSAARTVLRSLRALGWRRRGRV